MKVLVAPLDWGLGHATRCMPVVREFLRQGAQVELAVVKSNARLLREVFPDVRQRLAPSYNVVYPKHGFNMAAWLLKNGAHLNKVIRFEHEYAEKMVLRHHYDVVFSDNRFGFYSANAKSIYMTHQRRIAFPQALSAFETVGVLWHASMVKHFDEIWVPDQEQSPGFAGRLSHVSWKSEKVKFVGTLSRFSDLNQSVGGSVFDKGVSQKFNYVAVVSGVEPARSRFEELLRQTFLKIPGKHAIIQGRPSVGIKTWSSGNIQFFTHLSDVDFADVVKNSNWVVSRGGYSTIMDMACLGARCVFVPTPGQYEQVALAEELSQNKLAIHIPEKIFGKDSLLGATKSMDLVRPLKRPDTEGDAMLEKAVAEILNH